MLDLSTREQTAHFNKLVDHSLVRVAFAALAVEDILPTKKRQISPKAAIIQNVIGDDLFEHPQVAIKLKFFHAVRRRTMHKARAFRIGHKLRCTEITRLVPIALAAFSARERMQKAQARKFLGGNIAHTVPHPLVQPRLSKDVARKVVGQQEPFAHIGPALIRRARNLVKPVRNPCTVDHSLVAWHGPRRRCPDHNFRTLKIGSANNLELHPNSKALLVVILDFGLRQRGLLHRAPHHRLTALIERAVHEELHELFRNHPLGMIIHRQIRIGPIPRDAEALELFTLDIHPAFCKLAALLTEINDIHIVLVLALLAILLLDLPLDGKPVTVPARHIARIMPHHLMGPHNHILDGFVERMTNVQMPVRIRRAIMQDKRLTLCALFAQPVINADLSPAGQPLGLALWESRAHRKVGFR